MDPRFSDLFVVDASRAFDFFATSLRDVVERDPACAEAPPPGEEVSHDEFLYVSSILAHYALVECGNAEFLPIPGTLRQLHDLFVTDFGTWRDPELMETAAAQALMLTGYFGGAMRARHNLQTYIGWGRFFFDRAASGRSGRRQIVLHGMSERFPVWRDRLERLHGELWERPLRLDLPDAGSAN